MATGTSIVDYLNSTGGDSSYANRTKLASQYGITNYTGTATQNTQLLNTLRGGTTLAPATAPSNAGQINPVGSTNLPGTTMSSGNITGATAANVGLQSFIDTQTKIATDSQAQLEKREAQQNTDQKSILSFLKSAPSPEQVRSDAQAQTGIDPSSYFAGQKARIAEIDSLNQSYNKKVAERDKILGIAEENPTGMLQNALDSRIVKIKNNYAIELNQMSANINSKAATMQALEGNFNSAQDFVRQAVSDATSDTKYKLDTMMTFYQMNQDSIDRLDNRYQNALKTSISLAQQQYENQTAEKKQIGGLMIDYPSAGITMNDTLDQAIQKTSSYIRVNPAPVSSGGGGSGGGGGGVDTGGYKFTNTQLNNGSAKAGLDLASFKSLNPEVQNFFISTSATDIKAMRAELLKPGALELIESSNLSPAVKDYFKSQVKTPEQNEGTGTFGNPLSGGFFNNLWGGIKNLFQ